jgi:hypothetical protein
VQTEGVEGAEDLIGCTRDLAQPVEVFHAHQPASLAGTRVGEARDRGD